MATNMDQLIELIAIRDQVTTLSRKIGSLGQYRPGTHLYRSGE